MFQRSSLEDFIAMIQVARTLLALGFCSSSALIVTPSQAQMQPLSIREINVDSGALSAISAIENSEKIANSTNHKLIHFSDEVSEISNGHLD
jgi:hypothetical protein